MINISISIEVLNHNEVLKANKGSVIGGLLGNNSGIKKMVEDEIKKEVIKELEPSLIDGLKSNKVKAKIKIN